MQNPMMKFFVVAALACSALVGCRGDGDGAASSESGPDLAQPVTILERVNGNSAALKTIGKMHIETEEAYAALGDANIFPGEIDFGASDLVIVALGEQRTGGYSVNIESIQLQGGELAVTGKATVPGPDAITTQALTYPYSAVLIPNTAADKVVTYID
ncbi:MAG: protease complex subunit PrcB family protein [Phycisphaeraceae bacterium]|nr:protease complex subunit PrcB family protein [Phycisphaeraceae bacterium]